MDNQMVHFSGFKRSRTRCVVGGQSERRSGKPSYTRLKGSHTSWMDSRRTSQGSHLTVDQGDHVHAVLVDKVREAISKQIGEITHTLGGGWTIRDSVRPASQWIKEITHTLCGWTKKETVRRPSHRALVRSHTRCVGGPLKKRSTEPSLSGLTRSRTNCTV